MPRPASPSSLAFERASRRWPLALLALVGGLALAQQLQAEPMPDWNASIKPLLQQQCFDCHGGKKTKGGVDLARLANDPQVGKEFELWQRVKESVAAGDMPPEEDLAVVQKE